MTPPSLSLPAAFIIKIKRRLFDDSQVRVSKCVGLLTAGELGFYCGVNLNAKRPETG